MPMKKVVSQVEQSNDDDENMEYAEPSHNPFAFIQAVKSGSADFLEFVYLRPRVMGKVWQCFQTLMNDMTQFVRSNNTSDAGEGSDKETTKHT